MEGMNATLRTSLVTAAVAAGAALALATAAQAAPTPFASELAPTTVAAWNGTAMWSHYDPATKTYVLVQSVDGGAPTAVPVPPRSGGPFDIDLGTNRSGATCAVYTRDGDIYRLSVASGAETKISKLSSPALAERDPTIQRGRIAFIRRDGGFDQLRIGDTTSDSKGSTLVVKKKAIDGAELGISHIAYVESGPGFGFGEEIVHVRNIATHADRVVYKARSGGANSANVTRPTYVASPQGFVWARTNNGSGAGNRIVRYTLSGSKLTYAQGSPFYDTTAWAGDALGAMTSSALDGTACVDAAKNYCAVGLTGPLTFDLRP
jgi:hypothetical protein